MTTIYSEDRDQLVAQTIDLIAKHFATTDVQQPFVVGLPGGRSIVPFLGALAAWHQGLSAQQQERIHHTLVDERVSNDPAELNSNAVGPHLSAAQWHACAGLTAQQCEAQLTNVVGSDAKFAVMILGVGEDGHIASLFPNLWSEQGGLYFAIENSPKPPPGRTSVTAAAVREAGLRILLFLGEGKAEAYQRFVAQEDSQSCPARLACEGQGETVVVTDLKAT